MNCVYIGIMALGYRKLNWDKSRNRFLKIWWAAGSCVNSKVALFSCTLKALTRKCPNTGPFSKLMYDWAFLVAQMERICLQCRRPGFDPWVWKIPWIPIPVFLPGESHGQRRSLMDYSPRGHRVGLNWATNTFTHGWFTVLPYFLVYRKVI